MVEAEVDHVEDAVSGHRGRDGLGQEAAASVRAFPAEKTFLVENLSSNLAGGRSLALKWSQNSVRSS